MIGRIRPAETRSFEVTGTSLAEIHEAAMALRPGEGWDLVSAPVAMAKNSVTLTATATFARRDSVTEIEGATLAEIEAQVPEGWMLLGVRE